jgi:histone deacetylase 6
LAAFHHIVLPIAREFGPELVFVSAGFDAAEGDAIGGCRVTPEGFAHMTALLLSLAGGRVILCLEGTARGLLCEGNCSHEDQL